MKIKILLILFVLIFSLLQKSFSQITSPVNTVSMPSGQKQITTKTIVPQAQYWLRYYNKFQLSKKWILHTEFEERRYINPSRAYQTMLPRVHIHYFLGNGWEVLLGYAHFTNTQAVNKPHQTPTLNVPEERPMIGFEYKQINKRFEFNHRYWLEERFQHNYTSVSAPTELTKGYNFTLRGRYRLQIQYAIIKKETAKGTLRFNASEEIFINFTKGAVINTFDQNRIFLGLNYGLTKSLILEAGWYKIYQASATTVGQYYDRDALRVTLTHNIQLKKKDKLKPVQETVPQQ